ncbi:PTS sugar transporter subunit IIA [Streptococcus pluranimalium]|uniref:PTS fructose transporter subunit IIA n=1 Tax=Streptococcus pluranimalium TaxID=82348 RepID=A0A2L0D2M7_9STRE|nr:PTS sugar transporter subunit IIA [Streptococcus pluranimalium]AUW95821.1 PTS fructose transporter subunit IIA [Streptococcus pluranimalium]HEM6116553.1 PTS sugar transporter subunit IIA [Streptococcus suis]
MVKSLILLSHGHFSEELKKSTEMIMGPQDTIHTVGLLPEEGAQDFEEKLRDTIKDLDDYVVLADLMGGTPCNVAGKLLMQDYQFDLYAGMNMPMIIGFINSSLTDEPIDLKQFGAENIHKVNDLLNSFDDEDE